MRLPLSLRVAALLLAAAGCQSPDARGTPATESLVQAGTPTVSPDPLAEGNYSGERYGHAIALGDLDPLVPGNEMAVGAPGFNGNSGAVYVHHGPVDAGRVEQLSLDPATYPLAGLNAGLGTALAIGRYFPDAGCFLA